MRTPYTLRAQPDAVVALARQIEAVIAEQAKQQSGTRTDLPQNSEEGFQPIETRDEVARIAEVSAGNVHKIKRARGAALDRFMCRYVSKKGRNNCDI